MNKPKCEDVNRVCDFGEITEEVTIKSERTWIVDRTIGYDDIGHYENTGRFIKTVKYIKTCKYCSNIETVDIKNSYVMQTYKEI